MLLSINTFRNITALVAIYSVEVDYSSKGYILPVKVGGDHASKEISCLMKQPKSHVVVRVRALFATAFLTALVFA